MAASGVDGIACRHCSRLAPRDECAFVSRSETATSAQDERAFVSRSETATLPGFAITQGKHRESGGEVGVFLHEGAVPLVHPAAVLLLPALERFEQLAPPVVLGPLGVGEAVLAPGLHRLAEGVVVVVKPLLAHAGVFL